MEGSCLSLKKAASFFSGSVSILLISVILQFFAARTGEYPGEDGEMGMGGQHTDRMGHTFKCTIFHTKTYFSYPSGIISLSAVQHTDELFLLHFTTVFLLLVSPLCLLG